MNRVRLALCAALCALLAAVAISVGHAPSARAQGVPESYTTIASTWSLVFGPAQSTDDPGVGSDTTIITAPISLHDTAHLTHGNPSAVVSPRFSVPGATTTCRVFLWHNYNGTWQQGTVSAITTITAGTSRDEHGYMTDYPLTADTRGAAYYEPRFTAPSTGTLKRVQWAYGQRSR